MKRNQSSSVSIREWLVAVSSGATLAFSAWGLGGIPTWSLHVLFIGGILTFLIAVFPVSYCLKASRLKLQFSFTALFRLLHWPPFYLSLSFLIYLIIGALNPAAEVVVDERGWWVRAIEVPLSINLPTSVTADYQPMNAWRVIVGFSAAFSLMWGVWIGITRRKVILMVLWVFLLSGSAMGFVGILQHLMDAELVLWKFSSSNAHFWGSFFYRNQGAAYLNLLLILSGVLFFYHARKTQNYGCSGGPHWLCFLLFAGTATSVGLALSRGGILFACVLAVCFVSLVSIYSIRNILHITSIWSAIIPFCLLFVGSLLLISFVDANAIEERFGDIETTLETVDEDARAISTKATWDMAQDRLWLGWGAGSFRYIFPMYQRNYPEIYHGFFHKRKQEWVGRRAYRYAHNDIVQFVAEYGLIGSSLVLFSLLWILLKAAFQGMSTSPFVLLFLLVGVAASTCHALIEFIFNSPAYWLAFVGLIVTSAKLIQLESNRRASQDIGFSST